MGLFSRSEKRERIYTYNEVLKMMNTQGYENYVAIPVEGNTSKYFFRPDEREQKIDKHKEFVSRISGNGVYANNRSYNNYQQAKGYRTSRGFSR